MKVLLVTGQLAKDRVKNLSKLSKAETTVVDLSVPIAAFLSPTIIKNFLMRLDLKEFDLILVPGLVHADVSEVEKSIGIPTFKGPRDVADLPFVLDNLADVQLSAAIPADKLLSSKLKERALKQLKEFEQKLDIQNLLKKPGNFLIGELPIGKDFPARILAEIVNAPALTTFQLIERAKYYVASGAHMIDLGMIANQPRPEKIEEMIGKIKTELKVSVSIDTADPDEIKAGVKAGADLVLSINRSNVEQVAEAVKNIPVVILPGNGEIPKKPYERVQSLESNIKLAHQLGISKIIADPVLDPINFGLVESIVAYYEFAQRNPTVPLFFGAGNVVELIDADSIGVNALLAGIAFELGVSIIFTPEASSKTKGSVEELLTASKMMMLARQRGSHPKDIGIDLLAVKEKIGRGEEYDPTIEKDVEMINSQESEVFVGDPKGIFKILIDKDKIVVIQYSPQGKQNLIIKGKSAKAICDTIISHNLISRFDHAAYLGRELEKAETSLKTGKSYVQDMELF
ncbi:MAG: dihydropteroate synthase-like protein [Euryarchaeota archaeon]|nr:dihydropteroate synthase-like protein [Euryarchaeota archaeon]